jgi:MarR family transcriptional regulator, organic hydroperoxide resistance regulator
MTNAWASAYAEPNSSPGFMLWRDFMRWQRELNAILRPIGLTQPQFAALAVCGWLTRTSPDVTQQEVIDLLALDRMHVSQLLGRLEKDGLIQRHAASTDQRAKLIGLTSRGRDTLARALPLVETFDRAFFANQGRPQP